MQQRIGKYQLVRKLATGGMAEVFLARAEGPMGFAKRLVVKRILPHFVEDPNFVSMFLGEAKLAAELNHPNLVQIFDFGEADGQYYLAMEYIDGPNLRALNLAARAQSQPLSYGVAARVLTFAAEGLHAAHELRDDHGQLVNLVHRDISPDNILISRNGTVKVVDFGIAKTSGEPSRTKSGVIKGKLAYMPPEQLAREPLDRRADIFALGVVLYELICGAMPFDATSEVSIIQAIMNEEPLERASMRRHDVPPELDNIIAKCLEKNANDRYPTCKALQADLEHFISSTGTAVYASDLAQAIEALIPAVNESQTAVTTPSGHSAVAPALDPTVPSRPHQKRVSNARAVAADDGEELSNGTGQTRIRSKPGASGGLIAGVAVVLTLVGVAIGALAVFRPWEKLNDPVKVAVPENLKHPVVVEAAVEPTPVQAEPVEAAPSVPKPDAEPSAAPTGAPRTDPNPNPNPVPPAEPVKPAHLELRIRPFAVVYLDGKPMGETPMPPLSMPPGKHHLRLVNEKLGKNIEQDIVVKPGENPVFKLNFME